MGKQAIGQYLFNILKLLDVAGNVVIVGLLRVFIPMPPAAGSAHYTISEALDELRNAGSKPACFVCKALSWLFKPFNLKTKNYDHCQQSMTNSDGTPVQPDIGAA